MTRRRAWLWVGGQLLLGAATVDAGRRGPRWPTRHGGRRVAVGAAMAAGGVALAAWGARALGPALTPLPIPRPGTPVVHHGPYRLLRHPIYAGVSCAATGFALLSRPAATVPAVGLAWWLRRKAAHEERLLDQGAARNAHDRV